METGCASCCNIQQEQQRQQKYYKHFATTAVHAKENPHKKHLQPSPGRGRLRRWIVIGITEGYLRQLWRFPYPRDEAGCEQEPGKRGRWYKKEKNPHFPWPRHFPQGRTEQQSEAGLLFLFWVKEGINHKGKMPCNTVTQQKPLLAWKHLEDTARTQQWVRETWDFGCCLHPSLQPSFNNLSIWE